MSEYEALRSDLAGLGEAMNLYAGSVNRHTQLTDEQVGRIWDDIGELRDEINAVANRVESLTRAVMADPAEVAAAIVNDANRSLLFECARPDCYMREPHIHDRYDGHIIVGGSQVNRRLA